MKVHLYWFFFFFVFALHSAMHTNCSIRVYAEASLGYVRARFYRSDRWCVGGKSRMKGKTICDPKLSSEENAIRLYAIQNNVRQRNKKKEKKKKIEGSRDDPTEGKTRSLRALAWRKTQKTQSFGSRSPLPIPDIRSHFLNLSEYSCVVFHFPLCAAVVSVVVELSRGFSVSRYVFIMPDKQLFFLHNELSRARSPSKWKMKRVY